VMIGELDPSIHPPGTQPEPPRSDGAARQFQAQRRPPGVTKGSHESGRPGSNRRRPAWEAFGALVGQGFFGSGSRNGITQYSGDAIRLDNSSPGAAQNGSLNAAASHRALSPKRAPSVGGDAGGSPPTRAPVVAASHMRSFETGAVSGRSRVEASPGHERRREAS
jgi:hypothetical protein